MTENTFIHNERFNLEAGGQLAGFQLRYHTAGTYSPSSKVVWVFHALTANSNPFDWWKGLIGDDDLFNSSEYFIICCNVLGSCYGSTGPVEGDLTGKQTEKEFPLVTVRDNINAFQLLKQHLSIEQIYLAIGGSFGGFQALEFARITQEVEHLVTIASTAVESSYNIAIHEAQRLGIEASGFSDEGLVGARAVGMTTYRTKELLERTQAREKNQIDAFSSSSYVVHQGKKLANRFSAYSYYSLLKTLDTHDFSRGFENLKEAFETLSTNYLSIGIEEDLLSSASQIQRELQNAQGVQYVKINSKYGHDGFLLETDIISKTINSFLKQKTMTKVITVAAFKQQKNQEEIQLIDVREPSEYEADNIGGELIPLGEVASKLDLINTDKKVVVMCRSGKRSLSAAQIITETLGYEEVYNLEGGILEWNAQKN